ncbi:hypothetical protein IE077_000586 [Cardiosporidium cionae]|uniref:Conserved oligomeric Golgi complex subunit 5 n=1 Tax=Cardiosporidium cionae TaxID=476202 RepID=A0ABQ7J7P0_9APIC|nr:hypothetical protein IE077_000586 [Cardiosporidium cionae]|eukprot:KAF8820002.1 hypothetical protein IE077_000586 [Cardiosporidium cionae]
MDKPTENLLPSWLLGKDSDEAFGDPHDVELKLIQEETAHPLSFIRETLKKGPEAVLHTIKRLDDMAYRADAEFRSEIIIHHEHLLQNISTVVGMEEELTTLKKTINETKNEIQTLYDEFHTPFSEMQADLNCLKRVIAVQDVAKKLQRFLFVAQKLRFQLELEPTDLPKAANIIQELDSLLKIYSLKDIDVLSGEIQAIEASRERIIKEVDIFFQTGLQHQNKMELSVACEIFLSLELLSDRMQTYLTTTVDSLFESFETKCGEMQFLYSSSSSLFFDLLIIPLDL